MQVIRQVMTLNKIQAMVNTFIVGPVELHREA